MSVSYFETKTKIAALSAAFYDGDEQIRARLREGADFFPIANPEKDGMRSMVIRVNGEMFLVEDTRGGGRGVFSLAFPGR